MRTNLPKTLEVCGKELEIFTDFRDIIEICVALNDKELTDDDKGIILLNNLYKCELFDIPDLQEAVKKGMWFIDWGQTYNNEGENAPRLLDWEKDYNYICSAINLKVTNVIDIRDIDYMHWWTFLGYLSERGKCYLSTLIDIRDKLAKGKKLEKWELEFYNANKSDIDLEFYEEEDDFWKEVM